MGPCTRCGRIPVRPLRTTIIMSATDTAKEVIRIASTAGFSKDVIDLMDKKLSLLTSENAELKKKVSAFEIEVRQLRRQLEDFQPVAKPADICPYCRRATGQLIEIKPSENPHWGALGFKAAYYKCDSCGKSYDRSEEH